MKPFDVLTPGPVVTANEVVFHTPAPPKPAHLDYLRFCLNKAIGGKTLSACQAEINEIQMRQAPGSGFRSRRSRAAARAIRMARQAVDEKFLPRRQESRY